ALARPCGAVGGGGLRIARVLGEGGGLGGGGGGGGASGGGGGGGLVEPDRLVEPVGLLVVVAGAEQPLGARRPVGLERGGSLLGARGVGRAAEEGVEAGQRPRRHGRARLQLE